MKNIVVLAVFALACTNLSAACCGKKKQQNSKPSVAEACGMKKKNIQSCGNHPTKKPATPAQAE